MPIPVPASLIRHLKEQRCVVFVGAGLSAAAGLPGWKDLLGSMITDIENEVVTDGSTAELHSMMDAGKLLEVADHCRQQLGERRYQELLGEKLRGGSGDIPELHRLLTQLPFSAVVTTNYDKLLERAYARFRGELPKVVTSRDRESLGSLLFSGGFFILKAHGDIDDAASLVLTARDYREIIHTNSAFDGLFAALLMTRSLLFIGYSMNDPDFRLLLDRQLSTFGDNIPERYAVMGGVGIVEADVMKRASNIRVLPYPSGQHEELLVFLRSLSERVNSDGLMAETLPQGAGATSAGAVAKGEKPKRPGLTRTRDRRTLAPGQQEPAHLPIDLPSTEVKLTLRHDRIECQLQSNGQPSPSHLSETLSWTLLNHRVAELLGDGVYERRPGNYELLGRRLGSLLPADLLAAIPEDHVVTLAVDRELSNLPWELAICGHEADPLAIARKTVRRMGGDISLSRGLPGIQARVRVLVIGDPVAGPTIPEFPGAQKEAAEIAALYREIADCDLLLRAEATLDAVVSALSSTAYDIVHFAGHAWFDQHESFLGFGEQSVLTSGELRSLLGARPPAILVLNSHYTAFLPPGVRPSEPKRTGEEVPSSTRHIGFTQMAISVGIGAFVGCFESPMDEPAKQFGIGIHEELVGGKSIVEAVHTARRKTHFANPNDITALQYVLSGHPGYCLNKPN